MTVHGEDDSRDPVARNNFVLSGWRRVSTGLCGTRGPSSPCFYFTCLAHDQPSLFFFLSEKWLAIYFVFCRITNIGLLAFLRPPGPEIFQDEEGCILPRKWAISNKKWAISNKKWAISNNKWAVK